MRKSYYNYILIVLGIIIGSFAALQMSNLKLWSNYPLVLFLGFWISFVFVLDLKYSKKEDTKNKLLLSALSGVLLSISFPPFGFTPMLFIAFIPLFILQDKAEKNGSPHLFYIYNGLVLWNILDTYWVSNAALVPGMVAIWLNSFFMLAPWFAASFVGKRIPWLKWWSFICFWICFEFLHFNWEISWPWLTLGNAWSSMTHWIQWYEYTGVFGGSLWVLMSNVLIYHYFFRDKKVIKFNLKEFLILNKKQIIIVVGVIAIPIIISLIRYSNYIPEGKYGEVCVVQPNYEPHYEKFVVPEMDQITRLGRLAEISINKETKFILFPETCFGDTGGAIDYDKVADDNRIILLYDFIESHNNIPIVMGLTTIRHIASQADQTPYTRIQPRSNKLYEIANSAVILKSRTEKVPVYNKSKLVPGAEIFPYRQYLPFLKPLVEKLGGSISGLARQNERTVFEYDKYKIAPVICYESIYGNYLRGYILNGAQAIFVMTNDGWWDDTPGYRQHMAYSRLSAIEFRRPVVRSANTGISCFIDAKGDLGRQIPYGVHSATMQGITFSSDISFYAQFGDLIAYLALILGSIIVLYSLGKSFIG